MSISPVGPGLDDVAEDAAAAMATAPARSHELEAGPRAQGSAIGDVMDLPPVVSDTSKRTGGLDAREYRRPGTA